VGVSSAVSAEQTKVRVLDSEGSPVSGVAVYVRPIDTEMRSPPAEYAVMDQVDGRFEPHMLIVQVGTEVRFPNSDVVAHHVYSFSNPNDFILPLYKGDAHAPVTFEESGVVTLGCNIHDQMLGYILIVESDVFTMTDENGVAMLSIEKGSAAAIDIWSPRINAKRETLSQEISAEQPDEVVFRLSRKLRPPHNSDSGALKWSDY
jgi:plastocyanin